MAYETSYDTGLKPFNHDKNRGKWSSPKDFLFACLGHAFKPDAVFIYPWVLLRDNGILALIPYFITLVLCVVPIVFMQSFLGQFSSTGFISVFRISPLFKGIGYISLLINVISLAYYAVLGAIPLFYLLHTLTPIIPWSCQGSTTWMKETENLTSICTYSPNITDVGIPSVEFFDYELEPMTMYHRDHPEGRFSWLLLFCTFIIWAMVATIVLKPIEWIGKFLRYSCISVLVTMGLIVLRFLFLDGSTEALKSLLYGGSIYVDSYIYVTLVAFAALGPGWGSILTMASYNKFDTNIFKYSWILCIAQCGIFLGVALMSLLMVSFISRDEFGNMSFKFIHSQWMEFLFIPTGLTFIELPHIWSLIFFTMIILGCLNLLVVQLVSVLTSIFDEFEILRVLKREITLASVGILALASIFFCSNYGITSFEILSQISVSTQMILNLFLLIIVVWVYGRERFQRDVCFMTNRSYATWMVNVVRYVAPFFILIVWLIAVGFVILHLGKIVGWAVFFFLVIIGLVPWLIVPGYCIFKLFQVTGAFGTRFRRCARPTDWYPVDPLDRRRYEERFSETEMSHNLTTVELN